MELIGHVQLAPEPGQALHLRHLTGQQPQPTPVAQDRDPATAVLPYQELPVVPEQVVGLVQARAQGDQGKR